MSYRIPLPAGGRLDRLDILEPNSTAVQRFIRREGLGAYEPPTAACVLALCDAAGPGFVFFDIGANMGLYAHLAAAMFAPRQVWAFEPAPIAADVARRIAERNRLPVDVVEAALSNETGTADLFLSPVSDASNSLARGFRESEETLAVPTLRLDDHVETTGVGPDLVKIDVETFEPAVLAGAAETIDRFRPTIVIEVLKRRGHDHGVEITTAMEGRGYHCYALSASPDWTERAAVSGSGTADRDWLLSPEPLAEDFPERWTTWHRRLAACTVDRNPRPPITSSVRAAMRRGGPREVVAAAGRYVRSLRR